MSRFICKLKRLFRRDEDGAGLVEYGLLIGLIALAAVAGVTLLGGAVNTMYTNVGNYLSSLPLP